jgi:hypothetical protein
VEAIDLRPCPDDAISFAEFEQWERVARAETEAAIAAFEATGDVASANRARVTLALIDRAVIVANGGDANN